MKIVAPDDVDTFSEEETKTNNKKEVVKTFEDEVKDILRTPKIPKLVLDDKDKESSEFKRQVLFKVTELCREEIFPKHVKAAEVIEAKMDELHCQLIYQQKEIQHLLSCRHNLQETVDKLEAARKLAQEGDDHLRLRLKEVLQKLQDQCRSKTLAEIKMAQDLVNLKKKVEDQRVGITDASAKLNYYRTQVKAQTDIVKKHSKPLYLDKKKISFMKENLNDIRVNIEELVQRVKKLKTQVKIIGN